MGSGARRFPGDGAVVGRLHRQDGCARKFIAQRAVLFHDGCCQSVCADVAPREPDGRVQPGSVQGGVDWEERSGPVEPGVLVALLHVCRVQGMALAQIANHSEGVVCGALRQCAPWHLGVPHARLARATRTSQQFRGARRKQHQMGVVSLPLVSAHQCGDLRLPGELLSQAHFGGHARGVAKAIDSHAFSSGVWRPEDDDVSHSGTSG
mmetsp:Transcript_134313/g.428979  ORF Transcript_134313/g.428979 Transcript_134313/m.428979 type:complete len:208 (-) Transcript_134313:288-911(-)